jgi:transcriptional regulator with XRE-family HTH domain
VVTTLTGRYPEAPTVSVDRRGADLAPAARAASRRGELADFLRSRRERITPEQVGLPSGGRRRTPGLRREEVAQLSGLGLTWYTWLEQGRDIKVSAQVLEAVARTLQLDRHERSHLFTLADSPVTDAGPDCLAVSPHVLTILDKLDPLPACILNPRHDVLAYNSAYTKVSGNLDALPVDERNALWLAFMSPARRAIIIDWDEAVNRMVGTYRAAMADHVGEPAWKRLIERLEHASPEFAELWHRHDVYPPENLSKRLLHPELGLLSFTYTNLWLSPLVGVRMLTYVPANDATREALSRLDEVAAPPL